MANFLGYLLHETTTKQHSLAGRQIEMYNALLIS